MTASVPSLSYGQKPVPFSATVPMFSDAPDTNDSGHDHDHVTVIGDSLRVAPSLTVSPSKAMYHSLIIPGWGQLDNGRKWKAALFFAAEATCIAGFLYQSHRLGEEGLTDWEESVIRTDRNTFLIYYLGAKLLGIVDAYVDAQLADFDVDDITPPELKGNESSGK